jgi:triphosphoribosyl-dephospho-CoA synthase
VSTDLVAAAQLACLLEASAPKPGNVSPGRHFADTRYEDFLASAAAIGGPLLGVGTRSIGATIRLAIEATSRWTGSNTNLGILLLLVPLAGAASTIRSAEGLRLPDRDDPARGEAQPAGPGGDAVAGGLEASAPIAASELRCAVRQLLEATTIEDARDVYAAIRTASPGGLGQVDAEDVRTEPTVTLLEAMRMAADRDGIAREYATGFETTFSMGAPAIVTARRDGLSWDDAIVETFLRLVAAAPDSHIARRGGATLAARVSERAAAAVAAGGVRSSDGRRALAELDRAWREDGNTANPGTSADLTAAAIFVALLGGSWRESHAR